MLESVKISRRQSEIRQSLAALVGKTTPTDDETRSMTDLDTEYRNNETRYRAALIAEDNERREAGKELATRGSKEWGELIGRFELRQVALALDEGATLSGPTAEIVAEMRNRAGYRGIPVPWMALERRTGETVASGIPDPKETRPIIDRLFPASVAGRMGAQMINVDHGLVEWPVVTSSVAAGWADGETASVAGPTAFATTDKALGPNQTLGITMKVTRKSLKQAGDALEHARRRRRGEFRLRRSSRRRAAERRAARAAERVPGRDQHHEQLCSLRRRHHGQRAQSAGRTSRRREVSPSRAVAAMSATTIKTIEAVPDEYPSVTVSTEAAPFLPAAWARIESYIALRTTERAVEFVAEGPGDWQAPLRPVTLATVEEWRGAEWAVTTLDASPLGGLILKCTGPYRLTGTAGDDDAEVPAVLTEAVRRLAEYTAQIEFENVGNRSANVPDVWSGEFASPSWRARALQDSGAADLLRAYRRA